MAGLAIIISSVDPDRFRAALTLALAQAALGGRVEVYFHEYSVLLLHNAAHDDDDSGDLAGAGLPDRLQLLAMAQGAGITLTACQTGLALTNIPIEALVEGARAGGMVGLLAGLGSDRLISF